MIFIGIGLQCGRADARGTGPLHAIRAREELPMTDKPDLHPALRVPPSVRRGVGICLAYAAVFYAAFVLVGI